MHELGIVFHIIKTVEQLGQEQQLTEVSSVTLEIGEVSGILPDYLTDCWNWAVKKSTLLKGAALKVETIPAVTLCEACGSTYPTVEHGKICPCCGSGETHLLAGREVMIQEIEAC